MTETPPISESTASPLGAALPIPAIIENAGELAVTQYREFFDRVITNPTTRNAYRGSIERFLRWCDARGLGLSQVDAAELAAYEEEMRVSLSPTTISQYLTAPRSLFRHLDTRGVIEKNPFSTRAKTSPVAAGFDLLALLTMLAKMEPESLSRVFADEDIALSLLEQVRWPEEVICPACGGAAVVTAAEKDLHRYRCLNCGSDFTVLSGTMFLESPLPLRHLLRLLHRHILAIEPMSDGDLAKLFDVPAELIPELCQPLKAAIERSGIPFGGEKLLAAIDDKDRELVNDQFVRGMTRYAEMVAARERLQRAKSEGTAVEDLPPDISLDDFLAWLDAEIAEEDRWEWYVEDGRILRKLPDEAVDSALPADRLQSDDGGHDEQ